MLNREISTSAFYWYQNLCQTPSIEKVTASQTALVRIFFLQNGALGLLSFLERVILDFVIIFQDWSMLLRLVSKREAD